MLKFDDSNKMKLLDVLSKIYISIFLFDIDSNEFVPLKSNKFIDMWSSEPGGAYKNMMNVMSNITVEDCLEDVLEFADINTLNERMGDKTDISMVFEGKINGWCRQRFIVVERDENGYIKQVLHVVECIDEEKRRENHLLYLSQTDLMTGIFNRGHGENKIREFLSDGQRGAFCLFDIDHFKSINDIYGHAVGDEVLIAIADAMKAVKRENDIAMRLGGDEFAMYIRDVMTEEEVDKYIQRLFALIEEIDSRIEAINEHISISLGVSFYRDNETFDELYKSADSGVYTSKRCKGSSMTFC